MKKPTSKPDAIANRRRLSVNEKPRALRVVNLDSVTVKTVRGEAENNSRRQLLKLFRKETAAEFVGEVSPGFHRWGFSKGQFSLIDLIENVLHKLPEPAAVSLSTWTVAKADLSRLNELIDSDAISSFRILIDATFYSRQPQLIAAIRAKHGPEAIRITKNHAKFVTFSAGLFRIICRTSMNLNFNPRLEDIEVKDDPELFDFLEEIVTAIFNCHDPKEQIRSKEKVARDFYAIR